MATNEAAALIVRLNDHEEFNLEEMSLCVQELFSKGKDEITILLIGRVGRGKSALVNIFFGETVVEESESVYGATTDVSSHVTMRNDIRVIVIDTPGFFDSKLKKPSDLLLAEIASKVPDQKVDLILFCVKLGDRFEQSDADIIQVITNALGQDIWKNAMFALTFANELKPPRTRRQLQGNVDMEVYFKKKCAEMEGAIQSELQVTGCLSKEQSSRVPVVPVGDENPQLPHCNDWFTPFWYMAFKQVHERAKPAFLKLSLQRFSNSPQANGQPISNHSIDVSILQREILAQRAAQDHEAGSDGDAAIENNLWDKILHFFARLMPRVFGRFL